jgi:tetratricopeptide (TPR) repeat protein
VILRSTALATAARLTLWTSLALLMQPSAYGQAQKCQEALDLFREHRWAAAAQAYAECDSLSPGQTDALLYRGKALVNVSDFAGAAASLQSYLGFHPRADDALYLLGYVRFRQDQPRESLEVLQRAADIKPPLAGDLKIAALDYALLGDYYNAARYLEQSLKMDPDDIEARYHLGRVRYQQNQFDQALAAFEEVLRRDPGNLKAQYNLGLCLEAKNKTEKALAAYQKAIALDSAAAVHSDQPYLICGRLLTTLNRAREALPLLSKAVQIQPDAASAHYELGRAQFSLGHFEDARAQLEQAVRLNSADTAPHYLLGRVYTRLGKSKEAAAQFKVTEELIQKKNKESGGMATPR